MSIDTDVLIVGSGAAGLTAALNLAETHKVAVIAKSALSEGATGRAQGGIAAVLEEGDSFEAHVNDTMIAGAGLNDIKVVEHVVEGAPRAIQHLIDLGVPFASENGALHLTREGGHSHRRIVHVADATGFAVQQALETAAAKHPNITLVPDMVAIDLITGRHAVNFSTSGAVHGLYAYSRKSKRVETLRGRATILASGGAGRAYLYSTAPRGATGDGMAMAWRAGCRVSNMEFSSFTRLAFTICRSRTSSSPKPCAARAASCGSRRQGAGRSCRPSTSWRARAPRHRCPGDRRRDQAAGAGLRPPRHHSSRRDFVRSHFPNIYEKLLGLGIDIAKEPIPVVPAQHYTCGGVVADLDGRTDAPGLYAIGEVAQSGLHGANRLASNWLLEGLVFGEAAARHIAANLVALPEVPDIRSWDESRVTDSDEEVVIAQTWGEIRRFMWNYVGIVRTTKRLERAKHQIDMLRREVRDYYAHFRVTPDLIELRNLLEVADLIVRSALSRHESRGLHYTLDYPEMLSEAKDTILVP